MEAVVPLWMVRHSPELPAAEGRRSSSEVRHPWRGLGTLAAAATEESMSVPVEERHSLNSETHSRLHRGLRPWWGTNFGRALAMPLISQHSSSPRRGGACARSVGLVNSCTDQPFEPASPFVPA